MEDEVTCLPCAVVAPRRICPDIHPTGRVLLGFQGRTSIDSLDHFRVVVVLSSAVGAPSFLSRSIELVTLFSHPVH